MAGNQIAKRGPRAIPVELPALGGVTVYAGIRVADALAELMSDMTLYKGAKFSQVVQAVYEQGLRDGRRQVFDELDKVKQRPELKHRNPGRPVKKVAARKVAKKTVATKAAARKTTGGLQ